MVIAFADRTAWPEGGAGFSFVEQPVPPVATFGARYHSPGGPQKHHAENGRFSGDFASAIFGNIELSTDTLTSGCG